eukprot:scaffold82467_cov54-Attheya_sp.AAC.1
MAAERNGSDGVATPSATVSIKGPSMTVAFTLYFVIPLVCLGLASIFGPGVIPANQKETAKSRSVPLQVNVPSAASGNGAAPLMGAKVTDEQHRQRQEQKKQRKKKNNSKKIKSQYEQVAHVVEERKRAVREKVRLRTGATQQKQSSKPKQNVKQGRRTGEEAVKTEMDKTIATLKVEYQKNPNDAFTMIEYADALRERDVMIHDGGRNQLIAIDVYHNAISQIRERRQQLVNEGRPTNVPPNGVTVLDLNQELFFDLREKSIDGLLCSVFSNLGKLYFMANMFEKSVAAYNECLAIDEDYLDALTFRGSTQIVLGKYKEAGSDYTRVLELDQNRLFMDAFTGISKVLAVKEDNVAGGWETMVKVVEELIPAKEQHMNSMVVPEGKALLADHLKRLHLAMFTYHDVKTKDLKLAWEHLSEGMRVKMSVLPPYIRAIEEQRLNSVIQVFHEGFWSPNVGSQDRTPIFIIGFVRSGSTLLERVLDAHPMIVGTGEDSVFNGRLGEIRDAIVEATTQGGDLGATVNKLADGVVKEMMERWKSIDANTEKEDESTSDVEPLRFADKMLTNYNNVGFIHMLFPNALILHVAREPMDTIFSAFKHDFPSGGLDYTSDFSGLAHMYNDYRAIIEHWDRVLPGRITHVRYQDMVDDMPGVARALIDATGLEWHEDVLNFHKKKHAVNTLSTTQVRKGVYRDSLQSWKKYEAPLQPLVKLVGDRVKYDLKTTLPSYVPPSSLSDERVGTQ